jgi:hypothetical protein
MSEIVVNGVHQAGPIDTDHEQVRLWLNRVVHPDHYPHPDVAHNADGTVTIPAAVLADRLNSAWVHAQYRVNEQEAHAKALADLQALHDHACARATNAEIKEGAAAADAHLARTERDTARVAAKQAEREVEAVSVQKNIVVEDMKQQRRRADTNEAIRLIHEMVVTGCPSCSQLVADAMAARNRAERLRQLDAGKE